MFGRGLQQKSKFFTTMPRVGRGNYRFGAAPKFRPKVGELARDGGPALNLRIPSRNFERGR